MAVGHGPFVILLAEDDADDALMVADALAECGVAHDLRRVGDGEALMDYLLRRNAYDDPESAPRPHLVLLDLDMPGKDGRECLREIKGDARWRRLPVIVLSSSRQPTDVNDSYDLGANGYLVKPVEYASWIAMMRCLAQYWFDQITLPDTGPAGG